MKRYLAIFILCFSSLFSESWSGEDYAKNSSMQLTHAQRVLQNIEFNGDETILDLGCGDGKITRDLAKQAPHGKVIGIDPSPSMLLRAQQNEELSNLHFIEEKAETFSLSEHFDHIFAFHVMHWIVEQQKALENLYNHLRPGGQVHFVISPSKEGLPYDTALQKTIHKWNKAFEGFANSQQVYDLETYRKYLVDAGFHIDSIQYVYFEKNYPSSEDLKSWVKQWCPHRMFLPEKFKDPFMDELMGNYLIEMGIPHDSNGPVQWGEYVLFVTASKKPKHESQFSQ